MFWTIKKLFWDKEFTIHFPNKYIAGYISAFAFEKKAHFEIGKIDFGEYAFIFNLFGLLTIEFKMFIPIWGKHNTYSLELGLLGASIYMSLEDKRNDQAIEEHRKLIKERQLCSGQKLSEIK